MALPLPRPVGFGAGDELKVSLSFDGDRFPTPWLPVLGARAPPVPLLDVQLVRGCARGVLLRAAYTACAHRARSRGRRTRAAASPPCTRRPRPCRPRTCGCTASSSRRVWSRCGAARLPLTRLVLTRAQEFQNDTHWPKHVLVQYRWEEVSDVDSVAGLYAALTLGTQRNSGGMHSCGHF